MVHCSHWRYLIRPCGVVSAADLGESLIRAILGHVANSKDYLSDSAVELINLSRKDVYILGLLRVRDRGGGLQLIAQPFLATFCMASCVSLCAHVVPGLRIELKVYVTRFFRGSGGRSERLKKPPGKGGFVERYLIKELLCFSLLFSLVKEDQHEHVVGEPKDCRYRDRSETGLHLHDQRVG